jgi:hypothetical protein
MAEEWGKTVAKKVEARVSEEAERISTRRKRFEDGLERFRRQVLDLVGSVNAHIESEPNRIQVIILDTGLILAAAYKRLVTVEELGAFEGVPASVGRITLHREDRKAAAAADPEEVFITSSGIQTTFYRRSAGQTQIKLMGDPDFKQIIEYFGS